MSDEYESRVHRATWLNLPETTCYPQWERFVTADSMSVVDCWVTISFEATDVQTTNRLWQQYEKMPNHWKTSV